MKLIQLSVFVENRTGRLSAVCELLQSAGLNLRTLVLADSEKYGIVRLVTREWARAKELLEAGGYVVGLTEVLAIEVEDRPGRLAEILRLLEGAGLGLEYMYGFALRRRDSAVMVFRFADPDRALAVLQGAGVNLLDPVALFDN